MGDEMDGIGFKARCLSMALALVATCSIAQEQRPAVVPQALHAVRTAEGTAMRVARIARWSAVDVAETDWQAGSGIDAEHRARLCAALRDALQRSLQTEAQPGGRVLQVRARIVDVTSASPVLNVATTLLLFIPLDRGGAAVRIDAFDQANEQPLVSLALTGTGQLGDFAGHFSSYGHAEEVLLRSAEAFRRLLEQDDDVDNEQS